MEASMYEKVYIYIYIYIVREHLTGPQHYPDNGLVSGTRDEVSRNQGEEVLVAITDHGPTDPVGGEVRRRLLIRRLLIHDLGAGCAETVSETGCWRANCVWRLGTVAKCRSKILFTFYQKRSGFDGVMTPVSKGLTLLLDF
ncbi:hypothetical protein AVEN_199516-1 [Araneus ventricosus]|uniref:Uncharacterized protein n=1 Tax=Araneus ventricosus TaxID=182803 RepID=A0A4Y2SLS8_ARAVE|nr:hypothetical protein AVEN_199516-1 [Araneus ventricosus]